MKTSTTNTDCLLPTGETTCQCTTCFVEEPDLDHDYSGFTDGPSDEEIHAIACHAEADAELRAEQAYLDGTPMDHDEYWAACESNDLPW